jgi:hypothetical protein
MIAMSMISAYDKTCRDRIASASVYHAPRALMHVPARIGPGMGGVTAVDDGEPPGIG